MASLQPDTDTMSALSESQILKVQYESLGVLDLNQKRKVFIDSFF